MSGEICAANTMSEEIYLRGNLSSKFDYDESSRFSHAWNVHKYVTLAMDKPLAKSITRRKAMIFFISFHEATTEL